MSTTQKRKKKVKKEKRVVVGRPHLPRNTSHSYAQANLAFTARLWAASIQCGNGTQQLRPDSCGLPSFLRCASSHLYNTYWDVPCYLHTRSRAKMPFIGATFKSNYNFYSLKKKKERRKKDSVDELSRPRSNTPRPQQTP